ncbi:hypothetical protein [Microbispora sp. NPDC049633]|uniref:hypothetical protein n=1 Tax=Microbispora sp. NPDC049633 TaxID=3154355 RepID=UPI00343E6154
MGVLVDYFIADSERSARRALSGGPGAAGLPYVDCKGWLDELVFRVRAEAEPVGHPHVRRP